MEEELRKKIVYLNQELDVLKKLFHQNNNIDKNTYFLNLSDISLNDLKNAFDNIKINHNNKYFPTIFEIRKNSLTNEARIVYKFLKKINEQIINKNIEFKNLRIKKFLNNNGGWESFKNKVNKIQEDDFIDLYIVVKI